MNKLFRLDSPFMLALSRLADLVLLSVLWVVCCLPIITIGPSTAALYYVALKLARGEEVRITGTFFRGFKENFKQGVVMNLIFLVLGAVLLADYIIMAMAEGTFASVSGVCFFVMGVWLLCIIFYAYPLQAQFYNTVRQTLINAAQLCVRKFPTTVVVFVLNMFPAILAFVSFGLFVRMAPVWLLLMPGLSACLCAKLFVKIFDPFLKAAEEDKNK